MSHPKGSKAGKPQPERRLRVRSRRLDQVDEAKLALAFALMARRLVEETADREQVEAAVPDRREIA